MELLLGIKQMMIKETYVRGMESSFQLLNVPATNTDRYVGDASIDRRISIGGNRMVAILCWATP